MINPPELKTRHLPELCGIYEIRNLNNGKVYIGSSCNIRRRIHKHRQELRHGKHHSQKLQRAWNKYGETAFDVSVLELVPDHSKLEVREQIWIDRKGSVKQGYNVAPLAGGSCLGIKHTEEQRAKQSERISRPNQGFITPDGYPVTITHIVKFCQENGYNSRAFHALACGKMVSYKGWTHINAKPRQVEHIKTYEGFIDPAGNIVPPVTNLEAFSQERGLCPSNMGNVFKGRIPSHKGWRHINYKKNPRKKPVRKGKTHHGFIDPEGNPITITNLTKFCQEHDLCERMMSAIRQGKYAHHKGWTHSGAKPKQNKKIKTFTGFIDPGGNLMPPITNLSAFCKEHGLNNANMHKVYRGDMPSYKGYVHIGYQKED
jgi:group I intron endonuclease